jgi:protein ImuA
MSAARSEVLRDLAQRIQEIEAHSHPHRLPPLSLGIAPLDALLPGGRLPAGSLVELLSEADGTGAWTLSLLMAKQVCGEWKVLVLIDDQRCFYPPGAAQLGIDLNRSLVVRPRTRRDILLATNQSLRCSAVGAVVGWYDQLRTPDARRFQMAAEAGGGVGFLLRPSGALRAPSFANLRLRVAPSPLPLSPGTMGERGRGEGDAARRLCVEVVRCRGGKDGQSVMLEIGNEKGDVRVLPEVASSAAPARKARSSG